MDEKCLLVVCSLWNRWVVDEGRILVDRRKRRGSRMRLALHVMLTPFYLSRLEAMLHDSQAQVSIIRVKSKFYSSMSNIYDISSAVFIVSIVL